MPIAVRSYVATGLALVSAGVVTAGQVVPPLQKSQGRIVEAAVNLVAAVGNGQACSGYNTDGCDIWATPTYTPVAADPNGSWANIPANLFNALLSIPRAWMDGLNESSYALEVTGNWWVYSPTNVLGFDPADPPKITAVINEGIPFKPLSHAIGDQVAWWARANLPMNASCTGTVGPACSDIGPIFSVMFKVPVWTLASGYQFPVLYNPVSNAEGDLGEEIPGQTGELVPWSGQHVKLDPADIVTSVMNYFQADPSTNAPAPITLDDIGATLVRFAKAVVLAFNPWVPRSYLLKGWPYTALSPLFLPFVPLFCKTCNPDNPGGPPIGWVPSAAAEAAPAELVSAKTTEPVTPVADSEPSGSTGEPPVTGGSKRAETAESDNSAVTATSAAPEDTPAATAPVDTSTSASRASAARSGFPDLAPADVTAPSDPISVDTTPSVTAPSVVVDAASDTAEAPSESVVKPHRGQTRATTSDAQTNGASTTRGRVGADAG